LIEINLEEYEINDLDKGNYLYLEIDINDNSYTGWTKCVFREDDWEKFIKDLEEFIHFNKDEANISTGWGEEIYFSMKFIFKDNKGHIWVSGEIGYPVIFNRETNPSISHKVFYSLEADIISIEKFINNLKNIKRIEKVIL
jgi:hypothetical protein